MSENPSHRFTKVYVILLLSFPEEGGDGYIDSAHIEFTTLDKRKADDIQRLWNIVQKEQHTFQSKKMEKALKELEHKYGIITWSGEELRVEERELQ